MNRASVILKNAREDKCLEIIEISKKLKIPEHYLNAIESEQTLNFPSEPYCSLIIKDYANYLGLNGSDILSLFRRDFANPITKTTTSTNRVSITPQATFKFGVILSILIFLTYITGEYIKFNRSPFLKINWPDDTKVSKNSSLNITGTTDPEATVRINNDLIIVDPTGKFHKNLSIQDTELQVVVESKGSSGKQTTLKKTYHPK